MKTLINFFFMICILGSLQAQTGKGITTTTLSVNGNCGDCKKRIENAADIKGVKRCDWNEDTKVATLVFDSEKTDLSKIEKAIAAAGYETAHEKADAKAYKKLPDCCQYKTKACDKPNGK